MSEPKKYLITWDIGFGESNEIIECDSLEQANDEAFEAARQDFEIQASYSARLATPEDIEEFE